nr:hypothetical protein [uncultured Bacillus sp.]
MGWTIVILLLIAIALLALSFVKSKQNEKTIEQQIDQMTYTFKDEIYQLQQHLRNVEIDGEITALEAGVASTSSDRTLLRELLNLQRRGYSLDSIASKKQLSKEDIERLLAPFAKKNERGEVIS